MELASLIKPGRALAVRVGRQELSFTELDRTTARVAALLHSRGVGAGDRVGVMLGEVVELPTVYYGVLRAGAVVVPIDVAGSALHVGSVLERAGARLVFAWHEALDAAEAGAAFAGADYIVVHPASFDALLGDVPVGPDAAERAPGDLAVLLFPTDAVAVTHGELANGVIPLTAEGRRAC